ncbi:MAG: prephenate dehydrogenase [Anaeroplasmataceae bacterium]|nr:prephenate dehydrogenase [Anaeroplasmataceae bacterium]
MKICIVGLGLIGGSYAMGLSLKGHEVYGIDQNIKSIEYAKEKNFIKEGYVDDFHILSECDCIILAIYPQAILDFLRQHSSSFKEHQVITDVCGVKSSFVRKATLLAGKATYLSHHPMAGKEKIGIEYADSSIFKGANFLITPIDSLNEHAEDVLKKIACDLEFGRITTISIERHDQMIGFTSQLTHAIAVSLVNSDHDEDTVRFIGDSYRDLTRIAMINDTLWSELFLENKEYLLNHISSFETELDILKNALKHNDKETLKQLFNQSTQIRRKMEK